MLRYPAIFLATSLLSLTTFAQTPNGETPAPGHLVVVYRNGIIPADAADSITKTGAHITVSIARFGVVTIATPPTSTEAVRAALASQPGITAVLRDRYVTAHALQPHIILRPKPVIPAPLKSAPISTTPNDPSPPFIPPPLHPMQPANPPIADLDYNSPQGWAITQSGGFGNSVPGGPTTGPWNISMGAGVRIAILDSGVDASHPDITPNLTLNLSEVNQSPITGLPSPCDDGSPQDQQGHGTFTASLATAAIGPSSGLLIGVAPQATLLNIKVLERAPGPGPTAAAACEAGNASGLLSWVLQGIDDAVSNHADIISLSLGTLIDITTGDGAGWQATFNAATYAAAQAGTTIIAALGNDGLDLDTSLNRSAGLIELPAQSRNVLPVIASTNPACAENLIPNATCVPGPVTLASYSNYGAQNSIAAPGGSFPKTTTGPNGFITGACSSGLPNTTDGLPSNSQSFGCFNLGHTSYIQAIGTSAAAPLVAAAAAILHAAHPTWPPTQLIAALLTSATPNPNLPSPQLNLPAALTLQ